MHPKELFGREVLGLYTNGDKCPSPKGVEGHRWRQPMYGGEGIWQCEDCGQWTATDGMEMYWVGDDPTPRKRLVLGKDNVWRLE